MVIHFRHYIFACSTFNQVESNLDYAFHNTAVHRIYQTASYGCRPTCRHWCTVSPWRHPRSHRSCCRWLPSSCSATPRHRQTYTTVTEQRHNMSSSNLHHCHRKDTNMSSPNLHHGHREYTNMSSSIYTTVTVLRCHHYNIPVTEQAQTSSNLHHCHRTENNKMY